MFKKQYPICSWKEYNENLVSRGSIIFKDSFKHAHELNP